MESQPRTPLSRRAAQQILQKIESGEYAVGARLPAQRIMADAMGISRTVLREAISVLEASCRVRTAPGSGTYVTTVPAPPEKLASDGGIGPVGHYAKLEICRFRHVVEGECARLAAMRITDEDVESLMENLRLFKEQVRVGDFDQSAKVDGAFHHLIVEIANVPLFTDIHLALKDLLLDVLAMPTEMRNRGWEPVVEHERIVEALRRRDPDESVYFIKSHIARSAERLGYVMANDLL